jgi:radical SAM protein with 4Fe4S-binding SPASM domain
LFQKHKVNFGTNSVFTYSWTQEDVDYLLDYLVTINTNKSEQITAINHDHNENDVRNVSKILELYDYFIEGVIKRNLSNVVFFGRTDTVQWHCHLIKNMIAVRPDLKVQPCQLIDIPIGHFDENLRDTLENCEIHHLFDQKLSSKCIECKLLTLCRGGCQAYYYVPDGEKKQNVRCEILRGLVNLFNRYNYYGEKS